MKIRTNKNKELRNFFIFCVQAFSVVLIIVSLAMIITFSVEGMQQPKETEIVSCYDANDNEIIGQQCIEIKQGDISPQLVVSYGFFIIGILTLVFSMD